MNKPLKILRNTILFLIVLSMNGCLESKVMAKNGPDVLNDTTAAPMKKVHTRGTLIVDGNGKPLKLRGVLLEGWLMWNGTLWGAGLTSETKINNRLVQMAGEEATNRFRTAIYDHFITERDIEMISDLGFNMVRVPFNHTIFEDENALDGYSAVGWKYIDRLLNWCEKHKVYVILDFHAVPGGQGSFVSDPDLINVWFSPEKQQRTIDIWRTIAQRYRGRNIIAGYDLLNEPDPPRGIDLVNFHRRIIEAIRKVDPDHMLIIEGGQFASSDFSMYKGALDSNQVYGFHSYNLFADGTDEKRLRELSRLAKKHNVPLWNGEFGAHTLEWVRDEIALFENPEMRINGWTFWPWKRVSENSARYRHLAEIRITADWKKVAGGIAALFGPDKDITEEFAQQAMEAFIESIKAKNVVYDEEMKALLTGF